MSEAQRQRLHGTPRPLKAEKGAWRSESAEGARFDRLQLKSGARSAFLRRTYCSQLERSDRDRLATTSGPSPTTPPSAGEDWRHGEPTAGGAQY